MRLAKLGRWVVVSLILTAVGCGGDGSPDQTRSGTIQMSNARRIVVEAEDIEAGSIELPMVLEHHPDASGGRCLSVPGGAGKPGYGAGAGKEVFGKAVYSVDIPSSGDYVFHGRAFWMNGCGNSFKLVIDQSRAQAFSDQLYDKWHWVRGPTFELSAGTHHITILNREDGVKLDQFLLTTDTGYRPVGPE